MNKNMFFLKQKENKNGKSKFYQKKGFKVALTIILVVLLVGGFFVWKTDNILGKINPKGGLFQTLVHNIPGVKDGVKGEKENRINILLLGMRGNDMPGGGLLADTIMVASINAKDNKISLVSVPRDLYVDNPGWGNKSKINAVYAAGEEKAKGQGLQDMKKVISDISGIDIGYAASINFKGFTNLIDILGGVEVTLDQPFTEAMQFDEAHVCDSVVFTVPTGKFENKTTLTGSGRLRVVKSYPLCTNPVKECGGSFSLPAGKQTLDGAKALCYARSRVTSSDFERAKRQQIILQQIKEKALSMGTLTDFGKINEMLNNLGDNVRSDMQPWELQRVFDIYKGMQNLQIIQRVLENSEEGLLYNPPEVKATGYILLPIGDNYEKIREMFKNIFSLSSQSDIKPK